MKIRTISLTWFRQNLYQAVKGMLSRNNAIAMTQNRVITAYVIHPETFSHHFEGGMNYTCPLCGAPVEIKDTVFSSRFTLKPEVKKSECKACEKPIYLIRDIRPHVYVMGEKPKGFEK